MGQDERFWENIITGDKTWCFVMIRPPNDRVQKGWGKTLQIKKNAISKIAREDLNCFFFDAEDVIHQKFVPERQIVNAEFYVGV
jgi:hypothetical protein